MNKHIRSAGALLLVLTLALAAAACGTTDQIDPQTGDSTPELDPETETEAILSLEERLRGIHETVSPSVVNIQVMGPIPGSPGQQGPVGNGSGFVWDSEGHIVTNEHVVADAADLVVTFSDGAVVGAEVVGEDRDSDLAVIRVESLPDGVEPVELADFEEVGVGQIAVAIGNPFGLDGTMTQGIVSALGRMLPVRAESPDGGSYSIPDVVQTDASINPGNSGGVLVDINGQLIGVPSAMISDGFGSSGIGFAIPAAIVQQVVPVLIENGEYQHPWLGVEIATVTRAIAEALDLPDDQRGALVTRVTDGSPADEAGLQGGEETQTINGLELLIGGDIITEIDGNEVRDTSELITYQVRNTQVGDTVTLTILRDGESQALDVIMGVRP
ncbi:MAG: trypsin-like peptidase domain-containing protein [Dehalococcoidia bacterium]